MLSSIDFDGYIYSKTMKYLNYKLYIKNMKILFFKLLKFLISIIKYILLKNINFLIKLIRKFFSRNFKSHVKCKLSFYPSIFNRLKFIYFIINNDKYEKKILDDLVFFLVKFILFPAFRKLILIERFKNYLLKDLENTFRTSNPIDQIIPNTVSFFGIDDIPTPFMSMEEKNLSEEEQEIYRDLVKNIKIIPYKC